MRKVLYLFFPLFWACQQKQAPAQLSVYYWKTFFRLEAPAQQFLQDYHIQRLYVRYCDIILREGEAVPDAPVEMDTTHLKGKEIVPVIYIKNEVFLNREVSVEQLSERLSQYIAQINRTYKLSVSEVQLDCDWSLKSREPYFEFVQRFKAENPRLPFASIRSSTTIPRGFPLWRREC